MQPIGKYIVVSNIEEEIKTDSGIILSGEDANQFRYKKGRVIKPGTDVSVIKENDVIYYDKGQSFTMIINDGQYTIIREVDVVVVS
jgi:co-chaperonin GroES (HSP10)